MAMQGNVDALNSELDAMKRSRREMILEVQRQRESQLAQQIQAQIDFKHRDQALNQRQELMERQLSELQELFSSEEVMRKGIYTDLIYMQTTSKARFFLYFSSAYHFLRSLLKFI